MIWSLIKLRAEHNNPFYILLFLLRTFIDTLLVTFVDRFVDTFVNTLSSSFINSSHIVSESSVILATACSRIPNVIIFTCIVLLEFCTDIDLCYNSTFNSSYIFYDQIYIYICMIYVLLIFSIYLVLLSY